jgi:hypothetical protein
VLGDGAAWIRRVVAEQFPHAIHIVDVYHAREHVWKVANAVYGRGNPQGAVWANGVCGLLCEGQIEEVVKRIETLPPISAEPGALKNSPAIVWQCLLCPGRRRLDEATCWSHFRLLALSTFEPLYQNVVWIESGKSSGISEQIFLSPFVACGYFQTRIISLGIFDHFSNGFPFMRKTIWLAGTPVASHQTRSNESGPSFTRIFFAQEYFFWSIGAPSEAMYVHDLATGRG